MEVYLSFFTLSSANWRWARCLDTRLRQENRLSNRTDESVIYKNEIGQGKGCKEHFESQDSWIFLYSHEIPVSEYVGED